MDASFVANPRVSLAIGLRQQTLGQQEHRALFVGQLAPAVKASGKITFAANPVADSTITLNGTVWTFKASGASGAQTNIGGSLSATLTTLVTNLNASADAEVAKCTYYKVGNALFILFDTGGTSGNSYTLAASVATVSGATLAGGAAAPGSAAAGTLVSGLPRDVASMNALFGSGSHIALAANAFRSVNKVTVMDALPLADAASSVHATAQVLIAGTATAAATLTFKVVDGLDHAYEIDVASGDTADEVLTALAAAIDADLYMPFTYAHDGVGTMQFMAKNAGTHANSWLLAVSGSVPGITVTLTGWAGGATNPSLSTLFDPVDNIRYQTVVWPEVYTLSTVAAFLNARKNVDNNIMDGRAFVWRNVAFSTAKSDALALNSSEVVLLTNDPGSSGTWVGPHLPAAPDVLAARFAAARARRFEPGVSISDLVTIAAPTDQFGGMDKASLPYFNTPLLGVGLPAPGTGYSQAEQVELEGHGVTVAGMNQAGTGVIMGAVVTTWLTDASGNPDTTWKYLEWRDTHGAIREYYWLNLRSRFSQYRLSAGDIPTGYAIANEPLISGELMRLSDDLMNMALVQKGQKARQFIQDNKRVTLDLANRSVSIYLLVPMVSQLGAMVGTIEFSFSTN